MKNLFLSFLMFFSLGMNAQDDPLPVEIVDFSFDSYRQSFKVQVTDEYDIDKYRIIVTNENQDTIGYKWWGAYETPKNFYRIYEYKVSLPECTGIIYATLYKMEKSTMIYERERIISIVRNQ
tara:strand:- start:9898 stop:10263 length:366 start_codon:yes stop_codon:yes gene_type:complete